MGSRLHVAARSSPGLFWAQKRDALVMGSSADRCLVTSDPTWDPWDCPALGGDGSSAQWSPGSQRDHFHLETVLFLLSSLFSLQLSGCGQTTTHGALGVSAVLASRRLRGLPPTLNTQIFALPGKDAKGRKALGL